MYPRFGKLYPEGTAKLEKCDDYEAVKTALDGYGEFRDMFRVRSKSTAGPSASRLEL
jgi:hypothetical protein